VAFRPAVERPAVLDTLLLDDVVPIDGVVWLLDLIELVSKGSGLGRVCGGFGGGDGSGWLQRRGKGGSLE